MKTLKLLILLISFTASVQAQVSGTVFRDFNGNGSREVSASFNEIGVAGIQVTAFNSSNNIIASFTTASNGTYTIPASGSVYNNVKGSNTGFVPNGTAVRIEFTGLKTGDRPAPTGTDNKGNVQFVMAPATSISFAVNYPEEYSNAAPRLATSVYKEGHAPANDQVLITVDYNAIGAAKTYPNISTEGEQSQLGSTYGLAYHRLSNTLFASSFQKRHTSYGMSNSTGAIYRINNPTDNSSAGVSLFLDLNALYGFDIAGVNPHPNTITDFTTDNASYGQVGRISFGDMDISEDGMSLWTINLNDRYLYKIPLGSDPYNPVAPTSTAVIGRYPLFNICDCDADGANDLATDNDARPFAIKPYRGKVYVGLICNGQSTPTIFNNLRARVFAFDPITLTSTEVLNFALNYDRGNGNTAAIAFPNGVPAGSGYTAPHAANWRPWDDTYTTASTFQWSWYDPSYREGGYSQPMFGGLDFDDNGNMIIGLRDRFGDMVGDGVYDPAGTTLLEANGNGDLLRAQFNGTGWNFVLAEATHGTEFFFEDNYGGLHQETSMGGLAVYHGGNHIVNTAMDPVSNLSGGFDWTRFSDGGLDRSFEIVRRASGQAVASHIFAKANTLGEVELMSLAAPIEIGNRVWRDDDADGIQDANEPGLAAVIIELYNEAGTILLATTTTDTEGYWVFNNVNVSGGLRVQTKYKVRVSNTQYNMVGVGVLSGYFLTAKNVASVSATGYADNDAENVAGGWAEISLETGFSGHNSHDYDFGFAQVPLLAKDDFLLSAQKKSDRVLLSWTHEGSGVNDFEIERSVNGAQYSKIGSITNTIDSKFKFEDLNPGAGQILYRIKLVKANVVKYSNNQSVNFGQLNKTRLFPNPASSEIRIDILNNTSPSIEVYLFNQNGQLVARNIYKANAGNTMVQLTGLNQLANGTYFVKVSGSQGDISYQKLIISH